MFIKITKRRILRGLLIASVAFVLFTALGYFYIFKIVPLQDPEMKFNKEYIEKNILSGESRVYYRDGVTALGSFFDVNHRLYVPYDSIPTMLIDALVATEDARYFEHGGFDFKGFARAIFANIKARSFKQGGSTISQQTAKNIFGREEKSMQAKWHELVDALRLERRFGKQEILEFYLNQFHVVSNGRGAGIAALYFFNKPLSELSLSECAFIAGVVKGPYNYDPSSKKTPEAMERALERGKIRTRYVLKRMLEEDKITKAEYDLAEPPELNRGQFRFGLLSTLSEIESNLNGDFYQDLFDKLGIEDWRKSQIKIVTTLDAELQKAAEASVKQNLANLQQRINADTANPIQGALLALQNGMVMASQSGQNNIGYDRVFTAQRQFGSSWKPLLYALALKLGWRPLDELENEYNLFYHEGQFYFPRPDHANRAPRVSIVWSAVKSENIASVWLLAHLLDKLSMEDLRALAENESLLEETTLSASARKEVEFERAKRDVQTDLIFDYRAETARAIQALYYGRGYDKEVQKQIKYPERVKLLEHNYLLYESLSEETPEEEELFPHFTYADFKEIQRRVKQGLQNEQQPDDIFLLNDFKLRLAMRTFANFMKSIGVDRPLKEVLSMPLGSNELTLAEIAVAYQSILGGNLYKCLDSKLGEPCLIKEIRNSQGEVIFKNEIYTTKILSDSVVLPMQAMLRSVFRYGTAASAYRQITVSSPQGAKFLFPAMGKTGTTNENRTVAFMGALPLDTLMAIGSYVGFDDNSMLKGKNQSIAGASGALPQWNAFVQQAIKTSNIAEHIDFFDIDLLAGGEVSLHNMPPNMQIDISNGLPNEEGEAEYPEF